VSDDPIVNLHAVAAWDSLIVRDPGWRPAKASLSPRTILPDFLTRDGNYGPLRGFVV